MSPPWIAVLLSKVLVVTVRRAVLVVDRATLEGHAAGERAVGDSESAGIVDRSAQPVGGRVVDERRVRHVQRAALIVDSTAVVDGAVVGEHRVADVERALVQDAAAALARRRRRASAR